MLPADEGSSFHPSRHARRPFRGRPWLLVALLALMLSATYAVVIEPKRIEVTHQSITGRVDRKLRIAHITDLHTSGFGARERTVVLMLRKENPDIIVITGDTVDGGKLAVARDFMVNLSAPLGVWVVRGNSEHGTLQENEGADERAFYTSVGARFLENAGGAAREDVWVAGLDDPMTGAPNLKDALFGAPVEAFKLVLMHAPDYFAQIAGQFDLALAGHTHGGQVVLPLWGPLWLPQGGKRYLAGFYSQNSSLLYVSRGIGTSIAPVRFRARPELAIIDISPR